MTGHLVWCAQLTARMQQTSAKNGLITEANGREKEVRGGSVSAAFHLHSQYCQFIVCEDWSKGLMCQIDILGFRECFYSDFAVAAVVSVLHHQSTSSLCKSVLLTKLLRLKRESWKKSQNQSRSLAGNIHHLIWALLCNSNSTESKTATRGVKNIHGWSHFFLNSCQGGSVYYKVTALTCFKWFYCVSLYLHFGTTNHELQ